MNQIWVIQQKNRNRFRQYVARISRQTTKIFITNEKNEENMQIKQKQKLFN